MGAINYGSSDYITLGLRPYDTKKQAIRRFRAATALQNKHLNIMEV